MYILWYYKRLDNGDNVLILINYHSFKHDNMTV